MKRAIVLIVALIISINLSAQNKAVDKLFEKYSEREGYTSVIITKHMFNLIASAELENDDEFMEMIANLNNIRILSGPKGGEEGVNYYEELMPNLPKDQFEELMAIKDSGQEIKFLVREEKGKVAELLMVAGGSDENVLISISGLIDMKTVGKISKSLGIEGMENIEELNKNKNKNKKD